MSFAFEAIGTKWLIDIYQPLSPEKEKELKQHIDARIAKFDTAYSRFRADSLVTAMSQKAGTYRLPDDAEPLIHIYKELFELTDGLMTPLIGQVLVDAGYDAEYSLRQKKPLQSPKALGDVVIFEKPNLILKEPALLDFGAAGKGYLIDLVGDVLEENGVVGYCVDAGGDIRHRDPKAEPLKIGLENPHDFSQAIGITSISNQSLCASAGSRRKWGNFHHIINPTTLSSVDKVIATWVIAPTTLVADALATALFFAEPAVLTSHYRFEYLVLFSDFSIKKSPAFPGELFFADNDGL